LLLLTSCGKQKETLMQIARNYGFPVDVIYLLNNEIKQQTTQSDTNYTHSDRWEGSQKHNSCDMLKMYILKS